MTIAELCRREGIVQNLYYKWSRDFLEAGKKRLSGDVEREDYSTEVGALRSENRHLKQLYADLALERTEKSPRELAWYITDRRGYFISESTVYRILRDYDLITSPAYIVLSAADRFKHPTRRINELWQTDFTYFKIMGWSILGERPTILRPRGRSSVIIAR